MLYPAISRHVPYLALGNSSHGSTRITVKMHGSFHVRESIFLKLGAAFDSHDFFKYNAIVQLDSVVQLVS